VRTPRITARLGGFVAGRQKDKGVAVDLLAFQIAIQRCTVNFDMFNVHCLGVRLDGRNLRLYLRWRQ
jgi:hypothetical protein